MQAKIIIVHTTILTTRMKCDVGDEFSLVPYHINSQKVSLPNTIKETCIHWPPSRLGGVCAPIVAAGFTSAPSQIRTSLLTD